MPALFQITRPATDCVILASDPAQHGARTVDQQLSQLDIATLADPEQARHRRLTTSRHDKAIFRQQPVAPG
jgi:hypothetical protein